MKPGRWLLLLSTALALAACQKGAYEELENQMMLMQERLIELETQLADAQGHSERLASAVGELEAYVRDVETEVIDLSAYVSRDLLVNVEATVGSAKGKLQEVRARTNALTAALRPIDDVEE